jgi:hypothetical protein
MCRGTVVANPNVHEKTRNRRGSRFVLTVVRSEASAPIPEVASRSRGALLAAVYGIDPNAGVVEEDDNEDIVSLLIRSIIADVAGE